MSGLLGIQAATCLQFNITSPGWMSVFTLIRLTVFKNFSKQGVSYITANFYCVCVQEVHIFFIRFLSLLIKLRLAFKIFVVSQITLVRACVQA